MSFIDIFRKKRTYDVSSFVLPPGRAVYVREMAFHSIVGIIADAVARTDLTVSDKHRERQGRAWYLLAKKPNPLQSAFAFWHSFIEHLYDRGEAMIVPLGDSLYVADDFYCEQNVITAPAKITGVVVNGQSIRKELTRADVFYFRLNDVNLRSYLNQTLDLYGDLVKASADSFRLSHGNKYILKVSQLAANSADLDTVFNDELKTYLESASGVYPEYQGYELRRLETGDRQAQSTDLRALVSDEIKTAASVLRVPPALVAGDVQDTASATKQFMSFCVLPLLRMIEDELTAGLFSEKEVQNGSRVIFRTSRVLHRDPLDSANAADKLISSGVFSVNEIRNLFGVPVIEESWACKHFITKNYREVEMKE